MKASPEVRLGCLELAFGRFSALKTPEVALAKAQEFIDFCELDEKFQVKPPPGFGATTATKQGNGRRKKKG